MMEDNKDHLFELRVHESNTVSIKQCRHRFKMAIDHPARVWESHSDIPDLICALERYQERERIAIELMKRDGIDYKKYLSLSLTNKDLIDLERYSCYPDIDGARAICHIPKHHYPTEDFTPRVDPSDINPIF